MPSRNRDYWRRRIREQEREARRVGAVADRLQTIIEATDRQAASWPTQPVKDGKAYLVNRWQIESTANIQAMRANEGGDD